MEHALPCPERAATDPIFFALDSARFLRDEIDVFDTASPAEVTQLRHELAMLKYWIQESASDTAEYAALSEGLATFAGEMEQRLAG